MFLSAALPLLQQLFAHSPWIQTGGRVKKIEKLIFCSVFQRILYSKYYWKLCNKSTCRRYALHTLATRTQRKRILFTFFRSVRIEKYFWFLWQPPFCICMCADIHTHTQTRWCCAICECVPSVVVAVVVVAENGRTVKLMRHDAADAAAAAANDCNCLLPHHQPQQLHCQVFILRVAKIRKEK